MSGRLWVHIVIVFSSEIKSYMASSLASRLNLMINDVERARLTHLIAIRKLRILIG